MNEFLMQLLKELEKNLHRSNVRSVGMGISQQIWAEKRLTDQNHQMTAEEAAQEGAGGGREEKASEITPGHLP